ncbi:MAG: hypothetical protein E6G09_06530 [Actinobacteria bacterium]|nr:MAG: hypothetical protein E6G09_06530 [Actinomycetota bacterium]
MISPLARRAEEGRCGLSVTELFEYAKFSPHEIDPAMKEHAIESLVAVRDDLQAIRELAA